MGEYRCIWCMQDCDSEICPRCKHGDQVYKKNAGHVCQWSRLTINSVECKICGQIKRKGERP